MSALNTRCPCPLGLPGRREGQRYRRFHPVVHQDVAAPPGAGHRAAFGHSAVGKRLHHDPSRLTPTQREPGAPRLHLRGRLPTSAAPAPPPRDHPVTQGVGPAHDLCGSATTTAGVHEGSRPGESRCPHPGSGLGELLLAPQPLGVRHKVGQNVGSNTCSRRQAVASALSSGMESTPDEELPDEYVTPLRFLRYRAPSAVSSLAVRGVRHEASSRLGTRQPRSPDGARPSTAPVDLAHPSHPRRALQLEDVST